MAEQSLTSRSEPAAVQLPGPAVPSAPAGGRGNASAAAARTHHRPASGAQALARWPAYAATAILVLYVAMFIRGLGWQWAAIAAVRPGSSLRAPGPGAVPSGPPAPPAANPAATTGPAGVGAQKVPLPPTDEPPPRNATDQYGVYYDEHGVAVLGIDADPSGVYNVPPGRQVRIGGPQGQLFDVHEGGKITPATAVRELPTPVPSS